MRARLSMPALVLVILSASVPAMAQDRPVTVDRVQPAFSHLFADIGHDLTRLPSVANAITLGAGGALALAAP